MNKNISRFLTVIAVIFIILSVFSLWLARDIYDTANFTALSTKAFQQENVRNAIASVTVDRALQDRPLIKQVAGDYMQSFVAGILDSEAMEKVFQRAATRLHDYVLNDNRKEITVETGAIGTAIKPILDQVSPDLAKQLTDNIPDSVTIVSNQSVPEFNPWLSWMVAAGPILGFLGIILIILVLVCEKAFGRSLKRTGIYLGVGSLVFMLVVPYFRMLLSARVTSPERTTVALATYDVFTRDLLVYLLWVVLIAVILAFLGYFWPRIVNLVKRGK